MVNIMRYLQPCEVAQAVKLLQDGSSVCLVTRRFGVSPSVISRAWWRFRDTGKYSTRAGQGHRRATTHQQDRYLVLSARWFRWSTSCSLQSDSQGGTGVKISDQSVINQLHSSELRFRRSFVGLIFTPSHHAAWRAFARAHQNWQVCHLLHVLFTDESWFNLSGSDGYMRVWRSTGEHYQACNTFQHDWFGGVSVMVWDPISMGLLDLHVLNWGNLRGARYRGETLRPIVKPYTVADGPGFLAVNDNARPHVARVS